MKTVIIDTNFLLIPYEFKIDIFAGIRDLIDDNIRFVLAPGTFRELESIMDGQKGKPSAAAKLALELVRSKSIDEIKQKSLYTASDSNTHVHVDDLILKLSDKDTIVATQDKGLKARLREKGIRLIVLRGTKYLRLV